MIAPGEVQRVLGLLGGNPREVADTLQAKGIHGSHNTATCPISRYLMGEFPQAVVYTNAYDVGLVVPPGLEICNVPMLHPIRLFVQAFDSGEYPELEVAS